jgi:hypothetical protein
MQRCFTLEEVTGTILFCSSIAQDIAFRAAAIALEREQQSELASAPRPTATTVGRSIPRGERQFNEAAPQTDAKTSDVNSWRGNEISTPDVCLHLLVYSFAAHRFAHLTRSEVRP